MNPLGRLLVSGPNRETRWRRPEESTGFRVVARKRR